MLEGATIDGTTPVPHAPGLRYVGRHPTHRRPGRGRLTIRRVCQGGGAMTVTQGMPDDLPEFDLTEIENYLATHAPAPTPDTPDTAATRSGTDAAVPESGRTRRVRKLAGEVAEARHLAALQDSPVLVSAHTPRVLRTIRRGAEAMKLVQLRQNPAFTALAAVRARRFVTVTGLTALVIALGWSTAGVQAFAAGTAPQFSGRWWFAWAVEPFVSLALLTVVIARAFLASRGQVLTAPTARRVEHLFLAVTLLMNTWNHLPGVAEPFAFGQLVIHALGPIVAVCVVTVLPLLWAAIDDLPEHKPRPPHDSSAPIRPNSVAEAGMRSRERIATALARAIDLIRDGQLPTRPSANQVHKALGGAMNTARAVRDALRDHP